MQVAPRSRPLQAGRGLRPASDPPRQRSRDSKSWEEEGEGKRKEEEEVETLDYRTRDA